jgi:hypothetical protein
VLIQVHAGVVDQYVEDGRSAADTVPEGVAAGGRGNVEFGVEDLLVLAGLEAEILAVAGSGEEG